MSRYLSTFAIDFVNILLFLSLIDKCRYIEDIFYVDIPLSIFQYSADLDKNVTVARNQWLYYSYVHDFQIFESILATGFTFTSSTSIYCFQVRFLLSKSNFVFNLCRHDLRVYELGVLKHLLCFQVQ